MSKARHPLFLVAAVAAVAACADRPLDPLHDEGSAPEWTAIDGRSAVQEGHPAHAYISEMNARLAAEGAGIAIAKAEWLLAPGAGHTASTVYANDRQLRLDTRFVPGDARRLADGNNITHATFVPFAFANGSVNSTAAIQSSFDTWEAQPCFGVDLVARQLASGIVPSAILGVGGHTNDPYAADISTIGFLPGFLFDAVLGPGASRSVLGVTFTFVFIDGTGAPTDINDDGLDDTALKEVWYNDAFPWSTTGAAGTIDIETVALHENGHALELGHFGRIAVSNAGKLQVSPRAVMNAIILGTQRALLGTDNSALCGQFEGWP